MHRDDSLPWGTGNNSPASLPTLWAALHKPRALFRAHSCPTTQGRAAPEAAPRAPLTAEPSPQPSSWGLSVLGRGRDAGGHTSACAHAEKGEQLYYCYKYLPDLKLQIYNWAITESTQALKPEPPGFKYQVGSSLRF